MAIFLFVLCIINFIIGISNSASATTVFQQIVGGFAFVNASILFIGYAIVISIEELSKSIKKQDKQQLPGINGDIKNSVPAKEVKVKNSVLNGTDVKTLLIITSVVILIVVLLGIGSCIKSSLQSHNKKMFLKNPEKIKVFPQENWGILYEGMSPERVRSIIGNPEKELSTGNELIWYYPNGGKVIFKSKDNPLAPGELTEWLKPNN